MPISYRALVSLEIALAAVTFVALRFTTAPYGRHLREGWGVTVPARAGWLVMESVSSLLFAVLSIAVIFTPGYVAYVFSGSVLWIVFAIFMGRVRGAIEKKP